MKEKDAQPNVIGLLPLTVGLWLGYLLALLLIDHLFYPHPVFPPLYYLLNGFNALVGLGLAWWPRGRSVLGRAFLPLVIGLLSVVPVVTAQLMTMRLPASPASGPEGVLLRIMPLLLMALILTAWQYGWRYVILFSGGIALFTLGLHLFYFRPGGLSLLPPVTVLVIQTVSFLVVGYFISTLMRRLKKQQESLAQANAQLTDYAATLEDLTISRERNRMARELHDTLAHTLSGLTVQLETVKAYWDVDPAAAQTILAKSLDATRSGLQETRRALKSLRASPLDDLGLLLALRQLATETAARANLQLELLVPEHLPPLSPAVEQCIYRVAQEATANVAHHANAKNLSVQLTCRPGTILLRVRDDGLGFEVGHDKNSDHFGLPGMRERADLVGGSLTIASKPGQGTTIELTIQDIAA
ncbi:MAG: sensor histidine kinase [Anaerolineae bacterium]|nr:sensor histidine kinase [Anaerolineae bacterium]